MATMATRALHAFTDFAVATSQKHDAATRIANRLTGFVSSFDDNDVLPTKTIARLAEYGVSVRQLAGEHPTLATLVQGLERCFGGLATPTTEKPKTIIHVNQQAIADNAKHGTTLPILSVWQGAQEQRCSTVEINGPSRICYRPNDRLPSGASTWIETESEVQLCP